MLLGQIGFILLGKAKDFKVYRYIVNTDMLQAVLGLIKHVHPIPQ